MGDGHNKTEYSWNDIDEVIPKYQEMNLYKMSLFPPRYEPVVNMYTTFCNVLYVSIFLARCKPMYVMRVNLTKNTLFP